MRRLFVVFAVVVMVLALALPASAARPSHEKYSVSWQDDILAGGDPAVGCDFDYRYTSLEDWNLLYWGPDTETADRLILHLYTGGLHTNLDTGVTIVVKGGHWSWMMGVPGTVFGRDVGSGGEGWAGQTWYDSDYNVIKAVGRPGSEGGYWEEVCSALGGAAG